NSASAASTNDGNPAVGPVAITVNCASIDVLKVADAAAVSAGDQIGFTVTLTNNGAGTASGLSFSDPLPGGLTWTISPASAGWSIVAGNLVYAPSSLAAGASSSVHVIATTDAADCGRITNTATVS